MAISKKSTEAILFKVQGDYGYCLIAIFKKSTGALVQKWQGGQNYAYFLIAISIKFTEALLSRSPDEFQTRKEGDLNFSLTYIFHK